MTIKNNHFLMSLTLLSLMMNGCSTTNVITNNSTLTKANTADLDYTVGAQDYQIGSSDLLNIKVFQADELSREVRVDANGNINLPLLGTVSIAGLTQTEAENKLADLMRQSLLQDPQVTIFIKEFTSQRITIEGEVSKPGIYPINGKMTILQALAIAGGPASLADMKNVVLFRQKDNKDQAYLINLNNIQNGTNKDFLLRNEDKIVIHRSDSRYWLKEASTFLSPITILNGLAN